MGLRCKSTSSGCGCGAAESASSFAFILGGIGLLGARRTLRPVRTLLLLFLPLFVLFLRQHFLDLAGELLTAEAIARAQLWLVKTQREDGSWPIDTNLSTWVTTLSIGALADAGALTPHRRHCEACAAGRSNLDVVA